MYIRRYKVLFHCSFRNLSDKDANPTKVPLFDRIRQASNCRLGVTDVIQLHGPNKVTVGDFWTLIPPSEQTKKQERKLQDSIPDFTPGWLTSTVCLLKHSNNNYCIINIFVLRNLY